MDPLVSVVISTYQRSAVVEEAVRSVLAQTCPHFEVLVEDDGSTDGTAAALARLGDPRVSYAWAPNVGRPAPVRNRGIRRARGEILGFLDSDDLWAPAKLERQVAALRANPGLLAVSCDAHYLPPRGRTLLRLAADLRPSFDELLVDNVVVSSGVVVRREALDAVGFFDEAAEVRAVEDYDLWLRLLRHRDRSLEVLREPLVHYRTSPDSIALRGRWELAALRIVLAKHEGFSPGPVRAALACREHAVRRAELLEAFRAGTLPMGAWLAAGEIPLRRRVRLAARALLLGRARA